ncbi:hypothetical protein [Streptomyces abyssomicinicus]|uniref:hypothetical protein n=1 Tax=Streptomyces abyssomicinicus TaxID=574929 RepID=UPI001250AF29|nr:hypothetical protein [Streptomyces abyssomicinicus]
MKRERRVRPGDAAIDVPADSGSRGPTHRAADAAAGVPLGYGPERQELPIAATPVLDADGAFARGWLLGKTLAPVPVGEELGAALARRITAGCRAMGAAHILHVDLTGRGGTSTGSVSLAVGEEWTGIRPPSLLVTPDLRGAVLFPEAGHALVAGPVSFMTAAVGEGVDAARALFGRYAETVSVSRPGLSAVAAAHPPRNRAWSRPEEVAPDSAAARLLALLAAFTQGPCTAPEFARGWWENHRISQANGERIREPLADLFDQVFLTLEDYAVEPDLAEPGDLDDAGLREAVTRAWNSRRG